MACSLFTPLRQQFQGGDTIVHMQRLLIAPRALSWVPGMVKLTSVRLRRHLVMCKCCTMASLCTRHSLRCLKPVHGGCHNTNMAGLQHLQLLRSSNSVHLKYPAITHCVTHRYWSHSRTWQVFSVNKAAGCVSLPKVTSNLGSCCSSPRCPIPQFNGGSTAQFDASWFTWSFGAGWEVYHA